MQDWLPFFLAGQPIAGIDEAGRGPLAGPVVACAVVLDPNRPIVGLNDSKQLDALKRDQLYHEITEKALHIGIGEACHITIDRVNILEATFVAMRRAVANLSPQCELHGALVDGNRIVPGLKVLQRAIVDGDALVESIMAASIIAKVTRDRLMIDYDAQFPGYGFKKHKGYGTPEHQEALRRLGPSPIHRLTFAPVRLL